MFTTELRLMTSEERAALQSLTVPWREGCLDKSVSYFIALAGGMVAGMLLVALLALPLDYFRALSKAGDRVLILVGALGGLLCGTLSLQGRRLDEQKSRSVFQQDLASGQVRILHCTVSRAVQVSLDEDSGPSYFLDVGENTVLFLSGSAMYPSEDDAGELRSLFPNRKMDVVQAPISNTILDVVCLGEPLPEADLRELEDWPGDAYFPSNGELLAISLDTLNEDLKRLGVQRREKSSV